MKKLLFIALLGAMATSCVPPKQVQDLKAKYEESEKERSYLSNEQQRLETENAELSSQMAVMEKDLQEMEQDTSAMGQKLRQTMYQYEKLRDFNQELVDKQSQMQNTSEMENRRIMAELLVIQEKLQNKEDSLKLLQIELDEKRRNLDFLSQQLVEREARVAELEQIIADKDAAVRALRDRVKAALTGFEDKGIQVEMRNGRVYVSMEAELLFASGSSTVGSEGKKAVVQLAKVLETQSDLTILVEGHTDSDPIKTATIKDNWDLSVSRATAVVRLMQESSTIDPSILTAAGRGEYFPIADNSTAEGKAKNRRIEVILTPNLDQLFEILEEGANIQSNNETEEEPAVESAE